MKNRYEADPYWIYLTRRSDFESLNANPNRLSEEDTLWAKRNLESQKEKLESIAEIWPHLTRQQQKVLFLVGLRGWTEERVAQDLSTTVVMVGYWLEEASDIIRDYHQRKLDRA